MLLQRLKSKELVNCDDWLVDNVHYLTVMGSNAYGVSSDISDEDIYGFCIPKKKDIFPHLDGEIIGFGKKKERFEVWQQHHIKDEENRKEYDFQVFSIVKYFQLCMECNPNMIDSLFTPIRCVIHSTQVGNMVRQNRHLFLHKGAFHRFSGYAYSELHKNDTKMQHNEIIDIRNFEELYNIPHETKFSDITLEKENRGTIETLKDLSKENIEKYFDLYKKGLEKSKRFESQKINNLDLKFLYHVVRLLNECQMILDECDLDLERSREILKSIRRGEWSLPKIKDYFNMKQKILEKSYSESKLPNFPDENAIKTLLLNVLEQHFGSLDKIIHIEDKYDSYLKQISDICKKAGY